MPTRPAHTYTLLSHNMDHRPLRRWHGSGDSLLPELAGGHAELVEGVPSTLDMIGIPISFARRRRVDLFQLALTLR